MSTLAASACPASAASANEYEVWSCRGPAGQPLSADAWVSAETGSRADDVWVTDDCATGGPLALRMTASGTGARMPRLEQRFDLPRGAKITGYRLNRGIRAAGGFVWPYVYASAVREASGGDVRDSGCASYRLLPDFDCTVAGSLTDPGVPANQVTRPGVDLDGLSLWIACVSYLCGPPRVPPAAELALWGSTVAIADDVPPVLEDLGGVLAGSGPVGGRVNLFVEASDDNAGVSSFDLAVDGAPYQSVAVSTATCSRPYQVPRPCPADTGRVFTVDTTSLAEGGHVATGTITDAAGNQASFGPLAFDVEQPGSGPPPPDNGSPPVTRPVLGLDSTSITHRAGRPAALTGSLSTTDGMPIAGAALKVDTTVLTSKGSRPVSTSSVSTSADGSFKAAVPGQGARTVEVSFSPGDGRAPTALRVARVTTRLAVGMRAAPRKVRIGRKARFRGRLTGAGPAAGRVPVEIQAKVSGRWETVATVRTRANGAFLWRYRFRYVKREALFSFRAMVRANPGWPWPSVTSPVRKVRIRAARR